MMMKSALLIHSIQKSIRKRGLEEGQIVQKVIDTETIRRMEPYIPMDTGFLKDNSLKLGTKIGTGKIVQRAPYAKRQYYTNSGRFQSGKRGKKWFDRMKADHRDDILKAAADVAGGRMR